MTKKTLKTYAGKTSVYTIAGLLASAVLFAGAYAWLARKSPSQPAGRPEQLTIATNTEYAGSCPIFVAQEKGHFAGEGVLVTIQPHNTGKAALDATLGGKADLATVADVPLMFAVMSNRPVTAIATIFATEKDQGIIGRKDRGIAAPANLKGKRIGVTVGTSPHFVLESFLNRQKLSTSEVRILNFKPEELSDALARGDIDAAAAWEPFLGALRSQLADNGTTLYGEGVYEVLWNIAGARDYIVSHPEPIKRVLRALIRSARFCKDSPDMAMEITARGMKTDSAKLKELWPSYRFGVTLDQSLVLALEDESRWAIKNKLTARTDMPNYLNHVYLDALLAVTPSAVTVIH